MRTEHVGVAEGTVAAHRWDELLVFREASLEERNYHERHAQAGELGHPPPADKIGHGHSCGRTPSLAAPHAKQSGPGAGAQLCRRRCWLSSPCFVSVFKR